MSKNLVPLAIEAPGFLGLNTQNSGSVLPPGWAVELTNFIYDDIGRLASRKGSRQVNTTVIPNTPNIEQLHEYITNTGASVLIAAADNRIYKIESDVATEISGTITTPTANNWQFANFNGWCVGYQEGHNPIILTTAAGTFIDAPSTMYNGDMVLSGWGRSWTVYQNTLYYSDLLIHNYLGGSAGSFDLSKYWPNGMDQAVALVDFNGYLVVFGKESMIIYQDPDTPTSMSIVEGVDGVGCIARDSIQVIGNEVVFLSSTGVRTLGRVIQEKSMPLGDISRHVRDVVIRDATSDEGGNTIRSVYNRDDGMYIISIPGRSVSYVFDLKFPNEDGTWKVTTWNYGATALLYTQNLVMYLGAEAGYVSTYSLYLDGADSTGTGGATYNIVYEGVWNDFGEDAANYLKIPKRASILASGVSGGIIALRWALDYNSVWNETQLSFQILSDLAEYGIAQYGIDSYAGALEFERVNGNMTSAGQVLKIGMILTVDGTKFALQRIDILAKLGRLGI